MAARKGAVWSDFMISIKVAMMSACCVLVPVVEQLPPVVVVAGTEIAKSAKRKTMLFDNQVKSHKWPERGVGVFLAQLASLSRLFELWGSGVMDCS